MSNTVTTLFPDEPQPQSQNCYVDLSSPWNYWRPLFNPWSAWIVQDAPTTAPTPEQAKPAKPAEPADEDLKQAWQIEDEADEDEETEADDEDECLTLTMNDLKTMLRRVIKEELGSLRIVQGKE